MSNFYDNLTKQERGKLLSIYGNPNKLPWHLLWEEIERLEEGEEEEEYYPRRGTVEWNLARQQYEYDCNQADPDWLAERGL